MANFIVTVAKLRLQKNEYPNTKSVKLLPITESNGVLSNNDISYLIDNENFKVSPVVND